ETAVDTDVATLLPSELLQLLFEHLQPGIRFGVVLGQCRQHADTSHPLRRLRTNSQRPCRRATQERDDPAPFYSIGAHSTSSGQTVREVTISERPNSASGRDARYHRSNTVRPP